MSKGFKEFDKKYHQYRNSILEYECSLDMSLAQNIHFWKYRELMRRWNLKRVLIAVYEAGQTSEDWQKFRVSLKGMQTNVKLLRLQLRWECAVNMKAKGDTIDAEDEFCRIDNYIGALKRGGYLNAKWEIVQ